MVGAWVLTSVLAVAPVATAAPASAPVDSAPIADEAGASSAPEGSAEPESSPPSGVVPAPTLDPTLDPTLVPAPELPPPGESSEGIEFAVPPPEPDPTPEELEGEIAVPRFPDPGTAPNDGVSILVLSGTTIGLTAAGFSAGLAIGLRNQTPLSWLLPSTLVPTVGLLAFAGGGLYLGVKRRQAYRRWEIGYRVIGTPQGGGLRIGASFALLGALGFIPSGVFALNQGNDALGASLLAVGGTAAVLTPIMFTIAAKRKRDYQRTGGWRREPLPPRPSAPAAARIELMPMVTPLVGGFSLGAVGRF